MPEPTPQCPVLTSELQQQIKDTTAPAARLALLKDYIEQAIPNAQTQIDDWQAATRARTAAATTATPDPGCAVSYRYIAQVNRNSAEERVFVRHRARGGADPRGPARRRAQFRRAGGLSRGARRLPAATWR